jgi:hypothetical protein
MGGDGRLTPPPDTLWWCVCSSVQVSKSAGGHTLTAHSMQLRVSGVDAADPKAMAQAMKSLQQAKSQVHGEIAARHNTGSRLVSSRSSFHVAPQKPVAGRG